MRPLSPRLALAGLLLPLVLAAADPPPKAAAPAPDAPALAGDIRKAKAELKIDGQLDDADWARATPVGVNFIWGKKGEESKTPQMIARFLWDDFFLYIGYEVNDANLVAVPVGDPQGPADNRRQGCEIWLNPPKTQVDLAEFFLVFDSPDFFWETHQNAANHFNDILIVQGVAAWKKTKQAFVPFDLYFAREEFIADEEDHRFASAVALKPGKDGKPSTVNDEKDTDSGYTGELRLPWYGIGAPAAARTRIVVTPRQGTTPEVTKAGPWKMAGREISILAICQNGDSDDRYFTSCPSLVHGAFFHIQTAKYPRYRLVAE